DSNSPTPDIINESVILQPAGKLRLPSVNMLNLRLSREVVLGERWHIIPTVDFFNVTNAQTVIGEDTTLSSSYQLPFSAINPFESGCVAGWRARCFYMGSCVCS